MGNFTHLDASGNPSMVDVSDKLVTSRVAEARSIVLVNEEILSHLNQGDIQTKKGPVFQTAILAGVMGAKQTSNLIPLCHPLMISKCDVKIHINESNEIEVSCLVKVEGKTGVEMEALTGASIAALTIYDMCKAFSPDVVIKETRLISKKGGKSDYNVTNNE